jgi:TonB-linked SusC/RagA family outer membrane protein
MKKYCLPGWMYYCFLTFILSAVCVSVNADLPVNTAAYANINNSQRITVTGTVRDANGPLEGVNIAEKNGSGTTISKANGSYSISVADGNATLVFTAVGFEKQEVAVGGRTVINVEMKQSYTQLSDVIVTALGITREKKSLGYSVAEVDGKEMNRVVQENVLNSLSGKVPGVVINQTGGAGSSVSMVIRGASSLSNDNQPLFVIDGVPISNTMNNVSQVGTDNRVDFGNSISSLNPDDIASVTILKGPSAAALYGSRAGNGVVLITTKSGKGLNRMTININSSTVFDKPYRFLDWQTKYGSGQFSAIPIELSGNILTDPFGGLIQENVNGTGGGELDRGYFAVQWNSPLDEKGKKVPLPLVSHPNNMRDFVQTGITSTNGISLANSSDMMNYRLSYSNMQNKGIVPGSDLFRNTFDLGASLKVNKNLRISTNIDISRNNSNNRPASERGANPLQWAYAVSPHIDINDLRDYWEPGQEGIQQRTQYNGVYNNPFFLAYELNNGFVRDRLYGNLKADWQITKKLSLMMRYGLDTYQEQREFKVPNSYTSEKKGAYGLINIKAFESNADFLFTYKDKFNDFGLSLSAGGNTRYQKGSTLRNASKNGAGLIVPGVYTVQNILPASLDFSSYSYQKGINSIYGTASVDYREMVFVDVTGRNDWSSTLPKAAPYFYPSASLSLLVNKIAGINAADVNLIKLRGGMAQVGNDTDPYQLLSVLGNAGTWGDIPRLSTSGTLLNPDLKPEIATSYEVGIDISLFKNRLNFSGTYYMVDNKNQIFTTQLTSSTGYTSKKINAGLLRSKGLELSLGGTPVLTRNFRWDVNVNWSKNRTTVEELANEMPYFTFWEDAKGGAWTYLGEEVGDIYGPKVRTVTDKSSPYYGWPLLAEEDGGAKWVSIEARNTRNKIGNFNPKFLMGLQTSLTYKNISLSMSFDWRNGGQFISQTYRYGTEDFRSSLQFKQFVDIGSRSGKELRDWLVANADKYIIVKDGNFPRVGWPTPERASYPFEFSGIKLPYGGVFIPGVYATGYDAQGNPTGYAENLGENVLGADKNNPNATRPLPYAASNPWDFMQPSMFSASYIKLREITLSYALPQKWASSLRLHDASIGVFSRNIILWTESKIGVDPENAFQVSSDIQGGGIQFKQGIERYNVTPWVLPIGIKLNVTF